MADDILFGPLRRFLYSMHVPATYIHSTYSHFDFSPIQSIQCAAYFSFAHLASTQHFFRSVPLRPLSIPFPFQSLRPLRVRHSLPSALLPPPLLQPPHSANCIPLNAVPSSAPSFGPLHPTPRRSSVHTITSVRIRLHSLLSRLFTPASLTPSPRPPS